MLSIRRLLLAALASLAAIVAPLALTTGSALAAHNQVALLEEDDGLLSNPSQVMGQLRNLGVQRVRVYVEWSYVAAAPRSLDKPSNFDSASPRAASSDSASDGYHWARYDNIVHAAQANHLQLEFVLAGGAPYWASPNWPSRYARNIHYAWQPSVPEWGNFVHAVLAKYGGFVHAWEIYNEPNFGEDLAPETINGVDVGAKQYRSLLDAAWRVFAAAHRTRDTIIIGQVTARGNAGRNADFAQVKPLSFLRDLYCVSSGLRPLSGRGATALGCPANGRGFASAHPGLFHSSGVGIHPYPQGLAPDRDSSRDRNFITFNQIPRLEATLTSIDRAYSAHGGVRVYNNEYGYVTHPPNLNRLFVSPATAATYINQAEYLSWVDPHMQTYMQYLLVDPNTPPGCATCGHFYSGLEFADGTPKDTFYAFRMPLYLPNSRVRHGQPAEVWGAARPYATVGGHGSVTILWRKNPHARFTRVASAAPARGTGYFDLKVKFPGSGQVQTTWNEPGVGVIASRIASIIVR